MGTLAAVPLPACLRSRPFALLFAAQATSIVGDGISGVALAFAVVEAGGSAAVLGLVLGARALPIALLLLAGGVVADRLDRRRVIAAANGAMACAQVASAAAVVAGAPIAVLVAAQVVYGAAEAFFRPALRGAVPATVSAAHLQEANGLLAMTPAVGLVAGSALGGLLVALAGPATGIALDAATFAAAALLVLAMGRDPGERTAAGQSFAHDLGAGWHEVRGRSWLLVLTAAESFYALLVMPAVFVLGPLIAADRLGGASSWGAIIAALGGGLAIGGLVAGRVRAERPLVVSYAITVGLVPFFASLAVPLPTPAIAAAAVLTGVTLAVSNTLLETTIAEQVPADALSRVSSYRMLGSTAMQPLGLALIGPVSAGFGRSETVWLACVAVALNTAAVLGTPSVRAIRRR
jgi:MFS family permease